jgi:hypothetical protein
VHASICTIEAGLSNGTMKQTSDAMAQCLKQATQGTEKAAMGETRHNIMHTSRTTRVPFPRSCTATCALLIRSRLLGVSNCMARRGHTVGKCSGSHWQ